MCGGNGGTSGSVLTSSTTGRSAANASSHDDPSASGSVDENPFQSDQLGESMVRDIRDILGGVELGITLHDALFPGDLVEILIVEHAHDPAVIAQLRQYLATVISSAMLSSA